MTLAYPTSKCASRCSFLSLLSGRNENRYISAPHESLAARDEKAEVEGVSLESVAAAMGV